MSRFDFRKPYNVSVVPMISKTNSYSVPFSILLGGDVVAAVVIAANRPWVYVVLFESMDGKLNVVRCRTPTTYC